MPRPQLYGRSGTTCIPVGWAVGYRRVAEGTMNARAAFRMPGGTRGPFDPATGKWAVAPNAAYATDVPCRVQALTNDARDVTTAEDTTVVTRYLITVPAATAGLAVGHEATITGTDDPLLEGRVLRVDEVVLGSLLVERDLFCTVTDA